MSVIFTDRPTSHTENPTVKALTNVLKIPTLLEPWSSKLFAGLILCLYIVLYCFRVEVVNYSPEADCEIFTVALQMCRGFSPT